MSESEVGEYFSRVIKTQPGSASVHATIPQVVAAILGAKEGMSLVWSVEPGTGKVSVRSEKSKGRSSKQSKRD